VAFAQFPSVKVTALTGSDQSVSAVPCTYHGILLCETGGAVAHVRVYDNTTNSGTLLDSVKLASGESVGTWYERGKRAGTGVYVDIVSGTVEGSVSTSRAI
jgi:hypothetical protein